MTNYSKGRRREWAAIKFLTDSGFTAYRTAGSKGAFDVIAHDDKCVRFIQIKSESKKTSRLSDISSIEAISVPECATKELWVFRDYVGWHTVYLISGQEEIYPDKCKVVFYV